jgi:type VI protein secretion system component VasF
VSASLDSALPVSFRAFLHEVGEIEREIRATQAAARADLRPPPADELRQRLRNLLAEQDAAAQSQGRDPKSAPFQQGRHLMATIADATFQGFDWWGRDAWLEKPLAADYPLPDGVPEEIPAQIDQLLAAEHPDPELAQIYLLALATGAFPELETASYRRRLFAALCEPLPELANEADRLFPEAYRRRQRRGPASLLPPVRRWATAVLIAGAVLLALSAPLWLRATAAARQAVEQILAPGK